MNNIESNNMVSEKIVKFHMIFILSVCVLFGIINIMEENKIVGYLIITCGIIITILNIIFKNQIKKEVRGYILSIFQLILIITMSISKHELQDMFALMLGSMIVASIYYNIKCLYTHWIIMTVVSILGLFLKEMVSGEAAVSSLIKGIAGINVGAFITVYLIKYSIKIIQEVKEAQEKSDKLMLEVQEHVKEAEVLTEQQTKVVSEAALKAVKQGRNVADSVANRMNVVTESASQSEKHADGIVNLTEEQVSAISQINNSIRIISEIVLETSETSEKNANLAGDVAEETRKMDDIVSAYR